MFKRSARNERPKLAKHFKQNRHTNARYCSNANNEEAKQAKDINRLDQLHQEIQTEAKQLQADCAVLLDDKKDYTLATEATRKLIFIDKVCADINQAIEQIEN